MHCEGKCHLKKEINKAEEKSNNPNKPIPITKTKIKTFPVFLDQITSNNVLVINKYNKQKLYYLPHLKEIYKEIPTPPPQMIFKFI